MATWDDLHSADWLLGREFVARFRVVGVDPEKQVARLRVTEADGGHVAAEIGLDELAALVGSDLVYESGPDASGRRH
jgi:hypothetical protein